MKNITILSLFICLSLSSVYAADKTKQKPSLKQSVQQVLKDYYNQYKTDEYFSGIALSIALPNQAIENFYVGKESHSKSSPPINEKTLFSIGSITKSFTAARILQLEAEGKLKLDDPIIKYLPQYKKWGHITIEQLLNMSSGLPNYSDSATFNYLDSQTLTTIWNDLDLIAIVYPPEDLNPPLRKGYMYTNTGYVLASLIIESLTNNNFKASLQSELLEPLNLSSSFYPISEYSDEAQGRMASAYAYNQYDNPEILGKNVKTNNLTWAGAAGGIVSNPEDIIKWVKEIFIGNKILNAKQKQKMQALVSLKTGKPITTTTAEDPRGFSLGLIQAYNDKIGRYWFYQGETLGFRALYMYMPCNKIIIATTINSATNGENDHAGVLVQKVYGAILQKYPQYQCRD